MEVLICLSAALVAVVVWQGWAVRRARRDAEEAWLIVGGNSDRARSELARVQEDLERVTDERDRILRALAPNNAERYIEIDRVMQDARRIGIHTPAGPVKTCKPL